MSKDFTAFHIGHIVKIISIYNGKFINRLSEELNLTESQSRVLGYLIKHKDECITTVDLEKHFEISHPTLVGIIKRLEEKGFIKHIACTKDKRYKYLSVTDKSIEIFDRFIEILNKSEAVLTKGISDEELKLWKEISKKIYLNASEVQND